MLVDLDLARQLVEDRDRALLLVDQIVKRNLISANHTTGDVQRAIYHLAAELIYPPGEKPRFWHKQILRVGKDTINPYAEKVVDMPIQPGDIAFFDLGPVLNVEVDIGRTIVVEGDDIDPEKFRIRDDTERLFSECKAHYLLHQDMTGQELYEYVKYKVQKCGWQLSSQPHCGHLVGDFSQRKILETLECDYIKPENTKPMNFPDKFGNKRHWILEIHLVHPEKQFGAFYEDLLTL